MNSQDMVANGRRHSKRVTGLVGLLLIIAYTLCMSACGALMARGVGVAQAWHLESSSLPCAADRARGFDREIAAGLRACQIQ